jgi:hypothetical protein
LLFDHLKGSGKLKAIDGQVEPPGSQPLFEGLVARDNLGFHFESGIFQLSDYMIGTGALRPEQKDFEGLPECDIEIGHYRTGDSCSFLECTARPFLGYAAQRHRRPAHYGARGCLTVLGAWLRTRFSVSYSQCYVAEDSASQIGSRVVSGVDYIQLSKNWWERPGEIHREPATE